MEDANYSPSSETVKRLTQTKSWKELASIFREVVVFHTNYGQLQQPGSDQSNHTEVFGAPLSLRLVALSNCLQPPAKHLSYTGLPTGPLPLDMHQFKQLLAAVLIKQNKKYDL